MKLSIVTTLYQSALFIDEFYQRSTAVAKQLAGEDYEFILVNDGSSDDSLNLAVQLAEQDSHVIVLDLSRNLGHHKAMMTGLSHAIGDLIFLIDSDLEEEPEWLEAFSEQMGADQSDVVYGFQNKRKGRLFERCTGWIYYRIFRWLTGIEQPNNIVTARLMTRRYVEALVAHQERELNIGGIWIMTGFKQTKWAVNKHHLSPTTYTFSRKFSHLINAVTSFSSMPLIFSFYVGLLISLTAILFIIYLFFRFFFISMPPDGYTSIIVSVWLFSGLIIFFIGLQGIYLSKVFLEVKQRPYTIIRNVYRSPQQGNE